jgi:hypothetical protein
MIAATPLPIAWPSELANCAPAALFCGLLLTTSSLFPATC